MTTESKPNENRSYSVSFMLNATHADVDNYPHLGDAKGIEGEIISWLEDLGFGISSVVVKQTSEAADSPNPNMELKGRIMSRLVDLGFEAVDNEEGKKDDNETQP